MNRIHIGVIAAAALALTGCFFGGGGNDAPVPPLAGDAVPESASKSAQGMVDWIVALAGEDTGTRDPVDAAPFAPPLPEDAEPLPLP